MSPSGLALLKIKISNILAQQDHLGRDLRGQSKGNCLVGIQFVTIGGVQGGCGKNTLVRLMPVEAG
jgi:hypothetical protein